MVPKYIKLDTKAVIDIFIKTDKNKYLSKVEVNKEKVWRDYFKLDKVFNRNKYNNLVKLNEPRKYLFNYEILTDMVGVSIGLIHESFYEENQRKKKNIKNKTAENRKRRKNMTETQIEKDKENIKNEKDKKQEDFEEICETNNKKNIDAYKLLSKDEKKEKRLKE